MHLNVLKCGQMRSLRRLGLPAGQINVEQALSKWRDEIMWHSHDDYTANLLATYN